MSNPEIPKAQHPTATLWRIRRAVLPLNRPWIMGILNVTPDSFSDGGRHSTLEAAVGRGLEMVREGADILDIGGESTRPWAENVPVEEECQRVVPVLLALRERCDVPLSVDTRKTAVAVAALAAGADIVNDVTAFAEEGMAEAVAAAGAGAVLMHSRGTPQTMSRQNFYVEIAREVTQALAERAAFAESCGVSRDRICLDPGFGFSKVGMQNFALLRGLEELVALGYPVLVGASRKSFVGQAISAPLGTSPNNLPPPYRPPSERLAGSLAFAVAAILRGSHILRVHDVAETCDAARVALQCTPRDA